MSTRAVGARVPPTGSQYLLEAGDARAADDEELLDTFPVDALGGAFRGKVLAPWPNRIRDGRYSFRGDEHRLAISEPERGVALHGLVLWASWSPRRHASDEVVLAHVLHPQPGYPFTLELEVSYRLTADGLDGALRATNLGATPAPFGAGFHPTIAVGGEATLELPAGTHVPVDERLLPTGAAEPVTGTDYDFRRPCPLAGRALDTCFGDLERGPDGTARARLVTGAGEREVTVWMDRGFRFLHVYTAGTGVALEPTTCAPDAFNSGDGLMALAPGESFSGRWGLINTHREVQ
jgi:aldose 1-epimerase